MAKYPQKTQVATAVTKHSKHDLSCTHITSGNFMDFQVAKCIEMVPKQKVEINHNVFARMDALNVPTYGDASIHNRAFFVPYRTVFPAWNDFITDSVHTYSNNISNLVSTIPLIKNSVFVSLFTDRQELSTAVSASTACDIACLSPGGVWYYYNLTARGARFMKLLMSLGYRIDFNQRNTEDTYSALPLLAVAKVFYDWYYPSAYIQDEAATKINNWIKYDLASSDGDNRDFVDVFTRDDLYLFVDFMDKVNYDSDYFTSTWDNPVAPNTGAYSSIGLEDLTLKQADNDDVYSTVVVGEDNYSGTPLLLNSFGGVGVFSQYILNGLRSVTDYLKRHQLAGSRALDRYLARFGVALSAEKLGRSYYLSEYQNNQPIQFGDVTSQADTSDFGGEPLGAYAGKGISYGNGSNFAFETDEYGLLIIVSTIIPRVTYTQGQDRLTMRRSRFDFYTPEFDNMGVQAMSLKELYVPLNARNQYKTGSESSPEGFDYSEKVFGFVPRYADYKRGIDQITGDYVLGSRNKDLAAWTMERDITPMAKELGVENIVHSRNFLMGDDSEQYSRIFNVIEDDNVDHFKIHHMFNITSYFPGRSLFDTYEFEDDDKAQKVNLDINGVKAN